MKGRKVQSTILFLMMSLSGCQQAVTINVEVPSGNGIYPIESEPFAYRNGELLLASAGSARLSIDSDRAALPEAYFKGSEVSVTTPVTYTLSSTPSYANLPSFGTFDGSSASLTQLGGLMDIPVIGGGCIKGVQFTSEDCFLSGTYTFSDPLKATFNGNGKSLSLVCPHDYIAVDCSDTLHLYIPLPPQTYGTFSLAFDLQGESPLIVRVTGSPVTVSRAAVSVARPVKLRDRNALKALSFKASDNPSLSSDVIFSIDHASGCCYARIDDYVGLQHMKAAFSVDEGCTVMVGGSVQKSSISEQDYNRPVNLRVVGADGVGKDYTVTVSQFTGLPVMLIDTPDGTPITNRDEWLEGVRIRFDGAGIFEDVDCGSVNFIKGRGNATWNKFPKKPYNFKLGSSTPILGMPSNKRWSLIANYRDRTRIRNRTTYHISETILESLDWTTRNEWVEVIINGEHKGLYLLCESIRAGKDRCNVTKFDTDDDDRFIGLDDDPFAITGGYIFQIDSYFDEPYKFRTKNKNLPVEFKYPNDNIPQSMIDYCKSYMDTIEDLFVAKEFQKIYSQYIDIDSFVDFWIMAELAGNNDAGRPGSDYWHKDRGGKIFAGPVWDYDAFTYIHLNLKMSSALWYNYLLTDKTFCQTLKKHWESYRPALEQIPQWIDSEVEHIRLSEKYDSDLWVPMVGFDSIQGDEFYTWPQSISQMKYYFGQRMLLMDKRIAELNSAFK